MWGCCLILNILKFVAQYFVSWILKLEVNLSNTLKSPSHTLSFGGGGGGGGGVPIIPLVNVVH